MSVINKMLRDLDNRRSGAAGTVTGRPATMSGVSSVKGGKSSEEGRMSKMWRFLPLTLFLILGIAAAGWWYLGGDMLLAPSKTMTGTASNSGASSGSVVAVPPPVVASPMSAPPGAQPLPAQVDVASMAPEVKAEVPAVLPESKDGASMKQDVKMEQPEKASKAMPSVSAKSRPDSKSPATDPTKFPPAGSGSAAERASEGVVTAPVSKHSATGSSTTTAPKPPRPTPKPQVKPPADTPPLPNQAATLQVLAEAQNLWNSGAREPAIDLLRKAIALSEHSIRTASEPADLSVFASLVRELARMELTQGRVKEVWEMLVHLEPVIGMQADLWAVRGNAAQRLAKHQDSASSYLNALKLRPGEPRWMLGAAVSLAVQGKTGAAAELAEKARASGVVNPEVIVYLRQLGVPMSER